MVGLLPGTDRTRANPYADVTVVTGIGHARNLAVVASADVVVAVGGEWGTLSEIGLAGVLGPAGRAARRLAAGARSPACRARCATPTTAEEAVAIATAHSPVKPGQAVQLQDR